MATRKKTPGRPKWIPDKKINVKVETFAARGLNYKQLATSLGISNDTLINARKEYSEFSEAIERGRNQGVIAATNALFENVEKGDLSSIKYYLNNTDPENWKDRRDHTITADVESHADRLAHLR